MSAFAAKAKKRKRERENKRKRLMAVGWTSRCIIVYLELISLYSQPSVSLYFTGTQVEAY